jgi:hypothetical protein
MNTDELNIEESTMGYPKPKGVCDESVRITFFTNLSVYI